MPNSDTVLDEMCSDLRDLVSFFRKSQAECLSYAKGIKDTKRQTWFHAKAAAFGNAAEEASGKLLKWSRPR